MLYGAPARTRRKPRAPGTLSASTRGSTHSRSTAVPWFRGAVRDGHHDHARQLLLRAHAAKRELTFGQDVTFHKRDGRRDTVSSKKASVTRSLCFTCRFAGRARQHRLVVPPQASHRAGAVLVGSLPDCPAAAWLVVQCPPPCASNPFYVWQSDLGPPRFLVLATPCSRVIRVGGDRLAWCCVQRA